MKDRDWYWIGGLFLIALFAKDLGRFTLAIAGLSYFVWWMFMLIQLSVNPGGKSEDRKGRQIAALIHLLCVGTLLFYGLFDS